MPQNAVKLIWSVSACNFCPRSDVRTCQIKPGKLLSKLSSALKLDESLLDNSEGICTCCLADIDMIIRAVAIRGAMKDYFMDMVQNLQRGYNSTVNNNYFNGHYQAKTIPNIIDGCTDQLNYSQKVQQEMEQNTAPPPPALVARPPLGFTKNAEAAESLERSLEITPMRTVTPSTKKPKERLTRYQCMLCDKIAGSKSHCMEHLICHSPVRPFTCSQCMKTYKSRKACREHLIVMHGVEKIEENLQRLVIIDLEGLKQLDHVCTQYRKLYNAGTPKPPPEAMPSPSAFSQFKVEADENRSEMDGGSAWLYKPELPPILPPPLLQCVPSTSPLLTSNPVPKPQSFHDDTPAHPPPSKRTRKGTPHKLVHEPVPVTEDATPETFELEHIEELNDGACNNTNGSDKINTVVNTDTTDTAAFFYAATESHGDNDLKRSYFPSFQACKTEPSFPWMSMHSPPGGSKKPLPPCQICARSFPTKEKMADHMRSHSEVKQFSCLVCNRYFKYRRGVTNHLKEVHHLCDRAEISSKVASHEVGSIIPKSSRSKERKRAAIALKLANEESHDDDTNISQKVIQDTLSSLADIQQAADSTHIIPVLSSDESLPDVDNSNMSARPQCSPHQDDPTPDNSILSVEDGNTSSDENISTNDSKIVHTGATSAEMNDIIYTPSENDHNIIDLQLAQSGIMHAATTASYTA